MSNAPPAPLQTPVHVTINTPAPSTPVSAPSPVFQPASPSTTPLVSTGRPPLKKGPPTPSPMKPSNIFSYLSPTQHDEEGEEEKKESNEEVPVSPLDKEIKRMILKTGVDKNEIVAALIQYKVLGKEKFLKGASNPEEDTQWTINTFIRNHLDFLYAQKILKPNETLPPLDTIKK